jgi:hypothetical protein
MSSAQAIASMTYVLKSLLNNRLVQSEISASVGDVTVSTLPPERVVTGTDERGQLNLFLYRITPHSAWRGGLTGADGAPPGQRSLGLNLYYLLTAYSEQDFHAEILLGYAIQLMMETPVLTRDAILGALSAGSAGQTGNSSPLPHTVVAGSTLADQVERLEICPEFLSTEETSKLWSALQAPYRPSMAYKVSVVMMQATHAQG